MTHYVLKIEKMRLIDPNDDMIPSVSVCPLFNILVVQEIPKSYTKERWRSSRYVRIYLQVIMEEMDKEDRTEQEERIEKIKVEIE